MSYRAHGIALAYEVNQETFTADRKIGQLVGLDEDSKLTTTKADGEMFFALVDPVTVTDTGSALVAKSAGVTISGVAMVHVETFTGIAVGSRVYVGTTGIGVATGTSGYSLGFALEAPTANGQLIPVLMAPEVVPAP